MTHPFTPIYIAMAKAAEEIQATWKPVRGDYVHEPLFPDGVSLPDRFDWLTEPGQKRAWLPRLDQLLGMLGGVQAFEEAALRANDGGIPYIRGDEETDDWHELAIKMVMREKFGKRWDSQEGKWVKA